MSRSNQLAGLLTADPPSALDTINEINTALGNDASLSTTLTNSIATKASKSGDTFTGNVIVNKAGTATEPTMRVTSALESSSGIHSHGFSATFLNTSNNANAHGVAIGSKHADSNSLIIGQHDTTFDHFIVKGNGNVGVGVDPSNKLHVYDSADHARLSIQCANSSGRHWQFQSRNDGVFWIRDDTAGANRMTFDAAGKVGIGTTSPDMQLHIYTSNNGLLHLQSTDQDASFKLSDPGGHFQIATANNNTSLGANGRGEMLRFSGTSAIVLNEDGLDQDFRVESDTVSDALFVQGTSGKVGMGTTSPLGQLDIRGPSGTSCNNIHLTYIPNGADTDSWYFRTASNATFRIVNRSTGSGAYLQYNQSGWSSLSDRRWKTDWTPITGSLEKLLNIEVAKYHLLVGDDLSSLKKAKVKEGFNEIWDVGVSAQDCLEAGLEDIVDCPVLEGSGDENSQKGVNYNQLTAICVQAIQELSAKVTALESAS